MDPKDQGSSSWKNRREWLTAIGSILGLGVATAGYRLSRSSANAGKSLILIADKADNEDGKMGLSFVFRPLNNNQKISRIDIFFPPAISTGLQSAQPLTQELNLGVVSNFVENYERNRQPLPSNVTTVWEGNIPVAVQASYVFADESLIHRALYKLATRVMWPANGPFRLKFMDVIFDHVLPPDTKYAEVLTYALADEEEAQRKRFNPPR